MTGIIKVDDLRDAGNNSIISSNGSGTFTYTFNAGSIARAALAADIIDGTKLADDAINSEHYTDGSIDTAHINDLNVTTAKIAADAITGAKIADDAIDSEHYAAGSIDTAHIADLNVTTAKIAADAITAAKIADDVINSEHIAAGAVDLEHMSSESVDEDNLKISNAGSNGQFLSKQSGNTGGLTWAAASGGGKVLQVTQRTETGESTHSSDTYTATSLYGTITPSATSSKVLVVINGRWHVYKNGTPNIAGRGAIFRDIGGGGYSQIYPTSANISIGYTDQGGSVERAMYTQLTYTFLDSPNTTSAITYKLYARRSTSSGSNVYVGGSSHQQGAICMEIDGS